MHFVEKKKDENGKTHTSRSIVNYWELNKQAAPYVYAFYPIFSFGVRRVKSVNAAVDALERLAANQKALNQLLGRAAFAATILSSKAHDVRKGDFVDVTRIEPKLAPFNSDEMEIIGAINPDKLRCKRYPAL